MTTDSGEFIIFKGSDTAQPQYFDPRKWYFEPCNYSENEVYSPGYKTAQSALDAAELWEARESTI